MVKLVGEMCLLMVESIISKAGAEERNMRVECFPGIRVDQLR